MGVEGIGDYAEMLIRIKARKLARTAASPEVDWEDFAQNMRLDLWRRLSKFDPGKATLNTFIARVVEHKAASMLEARKARCRDYRRCRSSLNDPLAGKDGTVPVERGDMLDEDAGHLRTGVPSRSGEESGELGLDTKAALTRLPPELNGLGCHLLNQTKTEVAKETGIPRGTLHESTQKLRRRFKKAGLKIYL